jgi:hypothetical protein
MLTISTTDRDDQILATLTHRVRCLTFRQVARHWWNGAVGIQSARRRLLQMEQAGLVEHVMVFALPEIELTKPELVWKPGDVTPNFGPIAYRLKSRWYGETQNTPIVVATRRAAGRYGGSGGRKPRRTEATHDIGLAAVYLRLLKSDPNRAKNWVSEAQLVALGGGRNEKLPDALIRSNSNRGTIIEFGGQYSKAKLEEFHAAAKAKDFPYELW